MTSAQTPVAARLRAPGWKDPRLIVGIILVLLSVAGGVRLISGLDRTDPVYAADRVLLPGEEISAADLRVVDARLGDAAEQYVAATGEIQPGTFVIRPVAPGELLPREAVGDRSQSQDRTVTVTIDAATASTLTVGAVVDLWVSSREGGGGAGTVYLDPEVLIEEALVAQVPTGRSGLGGSTARAAVQIVVPADQVALVIAAVDQDGLLTLVPRPTGAGSADE